MLKPKTPQREVRADRYCGLGQAQWSNRTADHAMGSEAQRNAAKLSAELIQR